MKQSFAFATILFLIVSCTSKTDNLKTENTTATSTNKPDTFQIIQNTVNKIKLKIKENRLTKKTETEKDPEGGLVYGYFNQDNGIECLYSSDGGETGRDEIMSYFKDGKIILTECRFYWFDMDNNGKISNERLVAEKLYYLPESNLAKDTITVLNKNLKPPYPGMHFNTSAIPSSSKIVVKTIKMQDNLKKYGR